MPLISAARATALAVDVDPSHGLTRCSGSYRSAALSGALTLTNVYPAKLKLDPGGAARDVTLEAEASSEGMTRHIYNSADAAENIVVKDDTPATVATLRAGEEGEFFCDGTAWNLIRAIPAMNVMPGASTAAAGTTTSDAGVLPAGTSQYYPTTAADGTKGVRIHANDSVIGRVIEVANVAAAVLKVYPATGGTINGGSVDASVSSVSGHGVILRCTAALTWVVIN